MKDKIIGNKIIHLESIPSTNLYARQILKDKVPEGTIVIADIQTKGRGRKDRSWSSPKGGLWFSFILYPNIAPEQGMLLTMAASVSVAQAIEDLTKIKPVIKWPNDLLIDGKKVCGILTENEVKNGHIVHSIVGIGINVNNDIDKDLKDIAVSIKQILNTDTSQHMLLNTILYKLDINYNLILSKDYDDIKKKWNSYANILGKKIKVEEEKTIVGTVDNIDIDGHLILDTAKGKIKIKTGDITFL